MIDRYSLIWYFLLLFLLMLLPLNFVYYTYSTSVQWHIDATIWILQNKEPFFVINPLFPLAFLGAIPSILFYNLIYQRTMNQNLSEEFGQAVIFSLLMAIPIFGLGQRFGSNSMYFMFPISRFINLATIFFVLIPFTKRKVIDVVLVTSRKLTQHSAGLVISKEKTLSSTSRALQILLYVFFFFPSHIGMLFEDIQNHVAFSSSTFGFYFQEWNRQFLYYKEIQFGIFPFGDQILVLLASIIPIYFIYYIIKNMRKEKIKYRRLAFISVISVLSMWVLNWSRFVISTIGEAVPLIIPIPLVVIFGVFIAYVYRSQKTQLSSIPIDPEIIRQSIEETPIKMRRDDESIRVPLFDRIVGRLRRYPPVLSEEEENEDD